MFVLKRAFTYILPPTIRKVSPSFIPLTGTGEIRIQGSDFDEGSTVQIGGIDAGTVTLLYSTTLKASVPTMFEVGPKDVVVINPDGQRAVLPDAVTVIAPPKIKSIEPSSGGVDGGTEITITGEPTVEVQGRTYASKFIDSMKVFMGDEKATEVTVVSDHVLTAIAPPNTSGLKDVEIVDRVDQSDTLEDAFSYNELPQVIRITPDNGRLSGGVDVSIHGSNFQPDAKVYFGRGTGAYRTASSVEVLSSSLITAVTPIGQPGTDDVRVTNPDNQYAILEEAFTYNPLPTISSITPNYGSSAGGTKIIIEGTGFLQGATVTIGDLPATTQVKSDTTIEAVTPPLKPGVWDVRVTNPDTQEVVMTRGFISVGEVAYNYPNPFRASQGTTFRYVTNDPVQSITVKIFNMAGVPVDVIQQVDSNEVRWQNGDVYAGIYMYLMEIEFSNRNVKHFRGVLEVYE